MQKSGRDNRVDIELDPIRSQNGDTYLLVSAGQTEVYNFPDGKTFHLDTLIINNREATATRYNFYDSTGVTTPVFEVIIGASSSTLMAGLQGLLFGEGVYVLPSQFANGGMVTVGGPLRDD